MTSQEMIDRDIRQVLGDLQIQLIFARATIAELQEQLAAATPLTDEEETPADLYRAELAARRNGVGSQPQ